MGKIEGPGAPHPLERGAEAPTERGIPAAEAAIRQTLISYCKERDISWSEGSRNLGSQLLSKNNRVLLEAAKSGNTEVVKALLQTLKQIQITKLAEDTLSSSEQEWQKEINAFTANVECLLENLHECPEVEEIIDVLVNIVSQSKVVNNWLFKKVDRESQTKILENIFSAINTSSLSYQEKEKSIFVFFEKIDLNKLSQTQITKIASNIDSSYLVSLHNLCNINPNTVEEVQEWAKILQPYSGILIDHISLSEKNWDQRMEIAKNIVVNGGTEEVIQAMDRFIDETKRDDFLNMLLKNGDLQILFKYFRKFDTSYWYSSDWCELLDRAKNHVMGVEFAKQIPDSIKVLPDVDKLIQECKSSYEVLNKMNGETWQAIERKPVALEKGEEGFLIVFESHLETDLFSKSHDAHWAQMMVDKFPATEMTAPQMGREYYEKFKRFPFKELGFDLKFAHLADASFTEKRTKMTLPDATVLKHRLEDLKIDMTIESTTDDLSPRDFLNLHLAKIIPIDKLRQFLHDIHTHILPILSFIVSSPTKYVEYRDEWTNTLKEGLKILDEHTSSLSEQEYKEYFFRLSYAADAFSSENDNTNLKGVQLRDFPEEIGISGEEGSLMEIMLDREIEGERLSKEDLHNGWAKLFGDSVEKAP